MANYNKDLYQTRIYRIWSNMKTRCNNPNCTNFNLWGGRGIKYDSSWESFYGFYKDMKDGYNDSLSLNRVDNNGDYCKENCRWSTRREQANNTKRNRRLKWKNRFLTISQWSRLLNIKRSTIAQRYYVYGWDVEKCLTTK